jgi:hypothetical protein
LGELAAWKLEAVVQSPCLGNCVHGDSITTQKWGAAHTATRTDGGRWLCACVRGHRSAWNARKRHLLLPGLRSCADELRRGAVASFVAAALTEIYLGDVGSCQERLRRNGAARLIDLLLTKHPKGGGEAWTHRRWVLRQMIHSASPPAYLSSPAPTPVLDGALGTAGGGLDSVAQASRAFPSWERSTLTEIYLHHACSCREIEDGHALMMRRARHLLATAPVSCCNNVEDGHARAGGVQDVRAGGPRLPTQLLRLVSGVMMPSYDALMMRRACHLLATAPQSRCNNGIYPRNYCAW